jgi:hypothetical protein
MIGNGAIMSFIRDERYRKNIKKARGNFLAFVKKSATVKLWL